MLKLSFTILTATIITAISGCRTFDQQESVNAGFADVKPIFEERCLGCHQGSLLGSPVPDFQTAKGMITAGYVVPGEPDKSTLLNKIYLPGESAAQMPPVGHSLSQKEMNLIGEWILQGADWPQGETLRPAVLDRES